MTTVQYILIIIAVVIMVVGLYMIIRGITKQNNKPDPQTLERDKNGIPIVARHERQFVDKTEYKIESNKSLLIADDEATSSGLAEQASSTPEVPETSINHEISSIADVINQPAEQKESASFADERQPTAQSEKQTATQTTDAQSIASKLSDIHDAEDDLFSNLVSATEKLMPAIETVEEPEFVEHSPMLDQHLLAEADQDQNSPLNHAQENINITLLPRNEYETIDGKQILSLVSQYGLKYGAMNMFHRYEHKDGSGILWFSMMGVTENGIAPFDLNVLPTSQYHGLLLFLSLPHPKATQGFDSMMSVVNLIANDLNMLVLDEQNEILTRERRQHLRSQVEEYQASSY